MAIVVEFAGPLRARWAAGQDPIIPVLVPPGGGGGGVQGNAIQGALALPVQGGGAGLQGGNSIQGSGK